MSGRDLLSVVWERADASEPCFCADEIMRWPEGAERQLQNAGIIRRDDNVTSVVCDACDEGHVEEVVTIVHPAGSTPRAYMHCPEAGPVRVPLERLTQWAVDFAMLADAVASALDLAGELEEVVSGRIWYLGKTTIAGRSREVFLARGLMWMDAADTVARCEKLNAIRASVVFVPGAEPPEGVWRGDLPSIVSLKTVAGLGGNGRLELDRNHLESILSEGRRKAPVKARKSYPTPAGIGWRNVTVSMTDTHITVEANRRSVDYSFAEAGFEEKRKGQVPDAIWGLLKVFSMRGGMIPVSDDLLDRSTRTNLKQYVTELRRRLRALIPAIDGDPIPYDKDERCYRTAFRIVTEETIHFPTPVGTSWAQVSITLRGNDIIYIAVPEIERYSESTYLEEQGNEMHQWEVAEREAKLERRYDLRTLQIADETGKPDGRGTALIEVLRGQGVVKRSADDETMLDLCGFLTKLMGIKDSPFDFAPNDQKWVALFEASSEKR